MTDNNNNVFIRLSYKCYFYGCGYFKVNCINVMAQMKLKIDSMI